MRDLYPQLDIRGNRSIGNIAGWMRHYKNVQNHPVLGAEMVSKFFVFGVSQVNFCCVLDVRILYLDRVKRIWYLWPMRAAKVLARLRQEEPLERKPDIWPL